MRNPIFTKEHEEIVKKLIAARRESGLNQIEVARLLGKTQSYLSKLETGQIKIDVVCLNKLAKIYKKDINFFIK